jgi:hypothetical protein
MVSSVCSPWADADDLPEEVTGVHQPAVVQSMLFVASDQLWALSGRRWRGPGCTRRVTITESGGPAERAVIARGAPVTSPGPVLDRLMLPDDAVTEVTEVLDFAGVPIAAERWRLIDGRALEALDPATGRAVGWPWREITVAYAHGAPPPEGGRQAVITLASELLLARSASSACRLPKRVQTITRQGVSMTVLDPLDFFGKGLTGLPEVDAWLSSVNPGRARRRAAVFSPDVNRTKVRTHTTGG